MPTTQTIKPPPSRLAGLTPYTPPAPDPSIDLRLDANEGAPPSTATLEALRELTPEDLARYPDASALERAIADVHNVDPQRVVLTNGGDDAIDRIARATLEPGRTALLHTPTFVMIERAARLAGGTITTVPWPDDDFPLDEFTSAITDDTALVALVTPNNPTGCAISTDAIRATIDRASDVGAVTMVDLAYAEFADEDPTPALLDAPNTVIVRTFSKALGLAGARVGYAIAPPDIAARLRTVGAPYPVSTPSIALAGRALEQRTARAPFINRVREERTRLTAVLDELNITTTDSRANFVTATTTDAPFIRAALASLGISVRAFSDETTLRITLPGNERDFTRLARAIRTAINPDAILFDLDGVIADVTDSYRTAIIETARTYGVDLTLDDVQSAKRAGDANNDWVLTQRLLADRDITASLEEVTARFQSLYTGDASTTGLREKECTIPAPAILRRLAEKRPLAIVTGRPRAEARWFLERAGLSDLFPVLIAMEDAPPKPSPHPVRLALRQLNIDTAWMVGDTPDDAIAARRAGVVPIGFTLEGIPTRTALTDAKCACILDTPDELETRLP